ncbi:LacI family DNA-binding transcriptional regulator [Vallitalea okinawensis]|uniref:LacI family DNA-binding transcriptional regulator n=1 Tax=Vallitalea okinawensis TaxID=2078660 RepID=UPI000CFB388E|nr:LacI family DNA-binding transcriptional regulator [Vallitalea okinawensis]
MATIKDIAKKAGFAISTVSYALHNDPRVSEETKQKVLKVAEELNYRPNAYARNLKKQKTETIGLFLNELAGPFYNQVIKGVEEVVYSHGYDLVACSTYGGEKSTARRYLEENRVDSAIILSGASISDELILQVASKDFPIVLLDRELKGQHVYSVLIDNLTGAFEAMTHLIKLGYKKIGCLTGPSNSYDNEKRILGYQKALQENDLIDNPRWVIQGNFTEQGGYQAMKMMLASGELPEAIFSANDEMAIGALQALHEAEIKVPENIAIVGFDDIQLASYVNPSLTTVRHPKYELGSLAAQIVFQALQQDYFAETIVLPTKLIVRESCGYRS